MNSWQDAVNLASKLVSNDKIAGYVRAAVAGIFAMLIAKYQPLGSWITPEIQDAIAVAVATTVVGMWSHVVKDAADQQVQAKVADAKVEGKIEGHIEAAAVAGVPPPVIVFKKDTTK